MRLVGPSVLHSGLRAASTGTMMAHFCLCKISRTDFLFYDQILVVVSRNVQLWLLRRDRRFPIVLSTNLGIALPTIKARIPQFPLNHHSTTPTSDISRKPNFHRGVLHLCHKISQKRVYSVSIHRHNKMSVCKACEQPLVIEVEHDEDEQPSSSSAAANTRASETVPDDVELSCGCHFHW